MARVLRKRGEVTRNFPRRVEFVQHVRACLAKARELYPEFTLQDKDLAVVFYQKGRTAGYARWFDIGGGNIIYNVEFSVEAISIEWDNMVNDTIPHEIAHIVDKFLHGRSSGHGARWKRIAQSLGCSGQRTHSYAVTKARKTTKILYVASCGTEVWITKRTHNKIQRGQKRTITRTNGRLEAEHCQWKQIKV